jgi:hypothetical protein
MQHLCEVSASDKPSSHKAWYAVSILLGALIMAKNPPNHGKQWTKQDVIQLKTLAKENTPTRVAGLKLGRTAEAVQAKASEIGLSLKPTNQSPYNRKNP